MRERVMTTQSHLTTGDIALFYGAAHWQVRRVVDSLGEQIPRAGLYRLVPRTLLDRIGTELRKRGYLPTEETNHVVG
jgi:hypothetical protein